MKSCDKGTSIKISKGILYRFEENLDQTCFIFDIYNFRAFKLGKLEYLIFKNIDKQGFDIESILLDIRKEGFLTTTEEIENFIESLLHLKILTVE